MRITAIECACEWEVRVTRVVPAPPVLPVRLVAVEPIRGPKIVDHVLAADVLAILVVATGVLVWNSGRRARSHWVNLASSYSYDRRALATRCRVHVVCRSDEGPSWFRTSSPSPPLARQRLA